MQHISEGEESDVAGNRHWTRRHTGRFEPCPYGACALLGLRRRMIVRTGHRLLLAMGLASCARAPRGAPVSVVSFATDTARAQVLRDGVTHWFIYARSGPWAINALVVDPDACY